MSGAKVTPIKAQPAPCLSDEVIAQIETARDLVFDAQAISEVTAAAVLSDMTLDEHSTSRTLRLVSAMLGNVANMIEPMELARLVSEVSNGQA